MKNATAFESANDGTRIIEDLGVNSARLVDIILAFEDEFGIEVDDDSADKVQDAGRRRPDDPAEDGDRALGPGCRDNRDRAFGCGYRKRSHRR